MDANDFYNNTFSHLFCMVKNAGNLNCCKNHAPPGRSNITFPVNKEVLYFLKLFLVIFPFIKRLINYFAEWKKRKKSFRPSFSLKRTPGLILYFLLLLFWHFFTPEGGQHRCSPSRNLDLCNKISLFNLKEMIWRSS